MLVYKITVTAERERFMEGPLKDTSEHYIAAYSYDQAKQHVEDNMKRGGWKIISMRSEEVYVHDIRDSVDHTTD